ncbi:MAG: tetratricopeptide repeat protein [Candidatus Obscuribacter sp.]|nr:tetratricopeptide repeat protein [Candidatus Obscuribacter sp.]
MCSIFRKAGQTESALAEYKKALEIKPDSKIAQDAMSKLAKNGSSGSSK